jgi:hypothetical protein
MRKLPQHAFQTGWATSPWFAAAPAFCALAAMFCLGQARAQEDQLNKVHVEPPASRLGAGE